MKTYTENLGSGIGVFAAVVDAGTFAAASELMGMSPPGVSRAISRLEKRLNIRLFSRTTRTISLTEDGRRFYEQVMPHLRGIEEAAETARGGAASVRGTLRINVDPVFSRILLGENFGSRAVNTRRTAGQSVPRLARRALSTLRVPSLPTLRPGENSRILGFRGGVDDNPVGAAHLADLVTPYRRVISKHSWACRLNTRRDNRSRRVPLEARNDWADRVTKPRRRKH